MSPTLSSLYDHHALASFDKQRGLSTLVEGLDWSFQVEIGCLSFGDRYRWPVQILGTESEEDRTWLWAWANPSLSRFPSLLGAAGALRLLGENLALPELTESCLDVSEVDGHFLASLAGGVCRAAAYYRAPHEGGAAFLLIQAEPLPEPGDDPIARLLEIFPQALSILPLSDHRAALLGYLHHHDLVPVEEAEMVRVEQDGRPLLRATFDEFHRLTQLEGVVTPSGDATSF